MTHEEFLKAQTSMEEKKFNVQKMCEEIHAQYGTSETANYHILLMCDKIENRAFEAGRKSVIESLPELKWKRVHKDGPYLAVTVFNWFYRIEFVYNEFHLFCNGYYISCYLSLSEAKQAANEHYKKQIKQALGL